jgi:hypothetical protein
MALSILLLVFLLTLSSLLLGRLLLAEKFTPYSELPYGYPDSNDTLDMIISVTADK